MSGDASGSSASDDSHSDSDTPSLDTYSSLKLDPVLGIAIPLSASRASKASAQMAHSAAALAASESLAQLSLAPASLEATAHRAACLGPERLIRFRRQAMASLRIRALDHLTPNQVLVSTAPPHVQRVLRSTSGGGMNVSLISAILDDIGWLDNELSRDLLHGFPLIGDVPVNPQAPLAAVRKPAISVPQLLAEAPVFSHRLLDRQRQAGHRHDASSMDSTIWTQTIEEVDLGRMSTPVPVSGPLLGPVTRRSGVAQKSAKGIDKIRCIDDFAESRINDTTTVSRRISLGRIEHLTRVAQILHRHHPLLEVHLGKGDFKAAYRNCPIRLEDLAFLTSSFVTSLVWFTRLSSGPCRLAQWPPSTLGTGSEPL